MKSENIYSGVPSFRMKEIQLNKEIFFPLDLISVQGNPTNLLGIFKKS